MSGILGLGSAGSVSLNDELLKKLRGADEKSLINPMERKKKSTEEEANATNKISNKIKELLEGIKKFDLYQTNQNIFDSVSALTSGTSANFDADDTSNLTPGIINVNVKTLAKKDVYQSEIISNPSIKMPTGTITLKIGNKQYMFKSGGKKTYEDIVKEMNYKTGIKASLEKVGDSKYRIIVKSAKSGLSNKVTITESGNLKSSLGLSTISNHVQKSENFKAKIDGVNYDLSSNRAVLNNGLIITAKNTGKSSVTLERDNSSIVKAVEKLASLYNELSDMIDKYTKYDEDKGFAIISDSTTLRGIMSTIKNTFYKSYNGKSIFNYGVTFNSGGKMEVDTKTLSKALKNNFNDIKGLFLGKPQKEGIGTVLTKYINGLDDHKGLLTINGQKLDNSLNSIQNELKNQRESLDRKYRNMAQQFATYTKIITQMQNSFNSLKLIINANNKNN